LKPNRGTHAAGAFLAPVNPRGKGKAKTARRDITKKAGDPDFSWISGLLFMLKISA
jgi:hypothetical protein